ncbi:MAG: hypothetical protein R3F13_13290 [Prosthecobacter sp.]
MISDLTPDEMERIVQRHVDALMEYFECVQILVSNSSPEGTESVSKGAGNWYARQGMAQFFINLDRSETQAHKIAEHTQPPPPEEGEEWKPR